MIVATDFAVHIYSTSNSLLTQELRNGSSGKTVGYCVSAIDQNILYVATDQNQILKWSIKDAKRLGRWAIKGSISAIQAAQLDGKDHDTLFISDKLGKSWRITAHHFGIDGDPTKTEMASLVDLPKHIPSLKVLDNGNVLVAITSEGLLVGNVISSATTGLKDLKYNWRDIKCNEVPTTFDVQCLPRSGGEGKANSQQGSGHILNIVVGANRGTLYMFRDVLKKLDTTQRLSAAEMHWHRSAVGSVAWSRDGMSSMIFLSL